MVWCPPPQNKIKLNVDGSTRSKPGHVGIGGILRDEIGNIKAMFVASVGVRDSNEAEFLAIILMEMSIQQD